MKAVLKGARRHVSPGLVLGLVALMVALGGTAIAAKALKANTVGGKQLKPVTVRTSTDSLEPNSLSNLTTTCAPGEQILGGGIDVEPGQTTAVQIEESHAAGNGWQGIAYSTSAGTHQFTVQALCLAK
jgi:FtsP/CotA-like multicopper oxidase with cupredoxin domain